MLSDFSLAILYPLISKKCGSPLISKMWLVATGPEEAGQSRDIHGDESHCPRLLRRRTGRLNW